MTRSATAAFDGNRNLTALLVMGSIRWFGEKTFINHKISGPLPHDIALAAGLATALQNYSHGWHA